MFNFAKAFENSQNKEFQFSNTHRRSMGKTDVEGMLRKNAARNSDPELTKSLYNTGFMFKSNQSPECCGIRLSEAMMQTKDVSPRGAGRRTPFQSDAKQMLGISTRTSTDKMEKRSRSIVPEDKHFGAIGWGVNNPTITATDKRHVMPE